MLVPRSLALPPVATSAPDLLADRERIVTRGHRRCGPGLAGEQVVALGEAVVVGTGGVVARPEQPERGEVSHLPDEERHRALGLQPAADPHVQHRADVDAGGDPVWTVVALGRLVLAPARVDELAV